jgi:phenylacetic acid degradation operon negative regulatory protein
MICFGRAVSIARELSVNTKDLAVTGSDSNLPGLTARSVILSLLVSNHPMLPTPAHIVRVAGVFGIKGSAARAALSRMVTTGDLIRSDEGYELNARLLERRQRVLHEVSQETRAWDGCWEMVTVIGTGRVAGDRAALRSRLARLRLAELREGVWMRPANLSRSLGLDDEPILVVRGEPDAEVLDLIDRLWPLASWEEESQRLLRLMAAATAKVDRFTIAAAIVRHLLTDPVLPSELLPTPWSGPLVHTAWADYQEEFRLILDEAGASAS